MDVVNYGCLEINSLSEVLRLNPKSNIIKTLEVLHPISVII